MYSIRRANTDQGLIQLDVLLLGVPVVIQRKGAGAPSKWMDQGKAAGTTHI